MSVYEPEVFAMRVAATRLWLTEFVAELTNDRSMIESFIAAGEDLEEYRLVYYGDIPAYVDTVAIVQKVLADVTITPNEMLVALNVLFMEAVQHPLRNVTEADIISETANRVRGGAGVNVVAERMGLGRWTGVVMWVSHLIADLKSDSEIIKNMAAQGEYMSDEVRKRWDETPEFLAVLEAVAEVLNSSVATIPWVLVELEKLWIEATNNPNYSQMSSDIIAEAIKRLQSEVW